MVQCLKINYGKIITDTISNVNFFDDCHWNIQQSKIILMIYIIKLKINQWA